MDLIEGFKLDKHYIREIRNGNLLQLFCRYICCLINEIGSKPNKLSTHNFKYFIIHEKY